MIATKVFKRAPTGRHILIALLLLSIASNVAQLVLDNKDTTLSWRPIHRVEKTQILESSSVESRYGLYIFLDEYFKDATIITYSKKHLSRSDILIPSHKPKLFGLAHISEIITLKYDPRVSTKQYSLYMSNADTVASTIYGREFSGNWVVMVRDDDHGLRQLVHFIYDDFNILIDSRLIDASTLKEIHE